MKLNPGYSLNLIAEKYYLLPYGQQIADLRRGLCVNASGAYVLNLLKEDISYSELLNAYLEHFMDDPSQKEELSRDLDGLIGYLTSHGFCSGDVGKFIHNGEESFWLDIGGLSLRLYCPKALINASFLRDFQSSPKSGADLEVSVIFRRPDTAPTGKQIISNFELEVFDCPDVYLLKFPSLKTINSVMLSKYGDNAFVYCNQTYSEELAEQFFHVLRHIYLYLAGRRKMYAIHSASILYKGRAWLFSASSGTGKSTHAALWKKLYGAEYINGDLNLLAFDGDEPTVRGIPWCGTSEIYTKKTYPLGGIILLKRAETDYICELAPDEKILHILQRFISPIWTKSQLELALGFSERLSGKIFCTRLYCTKNDSAAKVIKNKIDSLNLVDFD